MLGACSTSPEPTPESTIAERPIAEGPLAQEIVGVDAWVNSSPLTIESLRGKVVLVDFWTYTCVNCIRTFPYLKLWHSKYADDGLVILGVHTPEFEFEKNLVNVTQAVEDYGLGWPVALDNNYDTWNNFSNRYWPAKYLIDKDGVIRYTHFGEGAYDETELMIRELLEETGAELGILDATLPNQQALDPSFLEDPTTRPTRELYGGWSRGYNDRLYGGGGYVGNQEYYKLKDSVVTFEDPDQHDESLIYLEGPWYTGPESLEHGRTTTDFEDYLFLRFSAKSANVVIELGPGSTEPFKVLVTLDGANLDSTNKGEDVVIEDDGRSFLIVDEPRLYSVVQAPGYGTYDLTLSSNSPDFNLFAFTFGVYESGI